MEGVLVLRDREARSVFPRFASLCTTIVIGISFTPDMATAESGFMESGQYIIADGIAKAPIKFCENYTVLSTSILWRISETHYVLEFDLHQPPDCAEDKSKSEFYDIDGVKVKRVSSWNRRKLMEVATKGPPPLIMPEISEGRTCSPHSRYYRLGGPDGSVSMQFIMTSRLPIGVALDSRCVWDENEYEDRYSESSAMLVYPVGSNYLAISIALPVAFYFSRETRSFCKSFAGPGITYRFLEKNEFEEAADAALTAENAYYDGEDAQSTPPELNKKISEAVENNLRNCEQ